MFPGPIIELHISNIHRREAHYHNSYVSKVATAVIAGLGRMATRSLFAQLPTCLPRYHGSHVLEHLDRGAPSPRALDLVGLECKADRCHPRPAAIRQRRQAGAAVR